MKKSAAKSSLNRNEASTLSNAWSVTLRFLFVLVAVATMTVALVSPAQAADPISWLLNRLAPPKPADILDHSRELTSSEQFSLWESKHNPRSDFGGPFVSREIMIPHIEFPMNHPNLKQVGSYKDWIHGAGLGPNLLIVDFADYLPKEVVDSLVFEVNGEKWVRWPLSPYDTQFKVILEQYLIDREVPYKVTSHFVGRSTSSRSTWQSSPDVGYEFSSKTSTNATVLGNGKFQYRPYPLRWGHLNRRISDYYYSQKHRLKNLDIAWEAALLGLPPVKNSKGQMVDASMTVRLMDKVARNESYQMSGFVLNDLEELTRLAHLAGMDAINYKEALARAFGAGLAELNLILGFVVTSSHLQNVRFELDKSFMPTGRIILLDLSDGRPIRPIMQANGADELLADWDKMVKDTNPILETITTFGGGRWMSPFRSDRMKGALKRAYVARVAEITTLTPREINTMFDTRPNAEFLSLSPTNDTAYFMKSLRPVGGEANSCQSIFN